MSEPTTSLQATVADESEEIAAEASTSIAKSEPEVEENGEEVKEEQVDPNALPEDACATLYLQNLNEKVKIPGESHLLIYNFPIQRRKYKMKPRTDVQ